jgi:hypothetical protein
MFDDLHNSISDFTSNIVEHLMELYAEEPYSNSDLFVNILIPMKKGVILPIKNKGNFYISNTNIHGKFYSTITKSYNDSNLKSIYYNNLHNMNSLILKCNNINTRHPYKIMQYKGLNKLFYTTSVHSAEKYNTMYSPSYTAILDILNNKNDDNYTKQLAIENKLRIY